MVAANVVVAGKTPPPRGVRHASRPYNLISTDRSPGDRPEIEAFIAQRFAEAYGARLDRFLPVLVALRDRAGNIVAAAGFGAADDGPLFLERYLALPIESAFTAKAKRPVARQSIVEIGNLAACTPGGTRLLAAAIARLLVDRGFEWAVFTATTPVRNAITRCGLLGYDFGPAERRAMGEALPLWGSYYDNDPRLVGGSLTSAAVALAHAEAA